MVSLPEDEQAFLCSALAQLAPDVRPVFVERVARSLGAHPDPGPGTVNAILRTVWSELWTPPAIEQKGPRWARITPSFARISRAARAPTESA